MFNNALIDFGLGAEETVWLHIFNHICYLSLL